MVARAGLGTLNHTGLTVRAVQVRDLTVAGVVIGCWPDGPGVSEEQNLLDLPVVTGVAILGRLPLGVSSWDPSRFSHAAATWFTPKLA